VPTVKGSFEAKYQFVPDFLKVIENYGQKLASRTKPGLSFQL
jgi:hypothetical protein